MPARLGELLHHLRAVSLLAESGTLEAGRGRRPVPCCPKVAEDLRASVARTADDVGNDRQRRGRLRGRHSELPKAVRAMMRGASAQGKTLDELADSFTDADITAHTCTRRTSPTPTSSFAPPANSASPGLHAVAVVHSVLLLRGLLADFRHVDLRALRSYAARAPAWAKGARRRANEAGPR